MADFIRGLFAEDQEEDKKDVAESGGLFDHLVTDTGIDPQEDDIETSPPDEPEGIKIPDVPDVPDTGLTHEQRRLQEKQSAGLTSKTAKEMLDIIQDRPSRTEGIEEVSEHEQFRMSAQDRQSTVRTTWMEDFKDIPRGVESGVRKLTFAIAINREISKVTEDWLNREFDVGLSNRNNMLNNLGTGEMAGKYRDHIARKYTAYEKTHEGESPPKALVRQWENEWLILNDKEGRDALWGYIGSMANLPQKNRGWGTGLVAVAEFAPAIAGNLIHPGIGVMATFGVIAGQAMESNLMAQEDAGQPLDMYAAWDGAIVEAALATPVEQLSLMFNVGFVKGLGKSMLRKAGANISYKGVEKFIGALGKSKVLQTAGAMGISGVLNMSEEMIQEQASLIGTVLAVNPDAPKDEIVAMVKKQMLTAEHGRRTGRAGKVGFQTGVLFGSLAGPIAVLQDARMAGEYLTPTQKTINEQREGAHRQPLKDDEDLTGHHVKPGTTVISKKKKGRTETLLGVEDSAEVIDEPVSVVDQSTSISERNDGTSTPQVIEEKTLKDADDARGVLDQLKGDTALNIHAEKAREHITKDVVLHTTYSSQMEAGDFQSAIATANQQVSNAQQLTTAYGGVIAGAVQDAKGKKQTLNEKVSSTFGEDAQIRTDTAQRNLQAAQTQLEHQKNEQNKAYFDRVNNPETQKQEVINEQIIERGAGNNENNKIFDAFVKEANYKDDTGEVDYYRGANLRKLADLKQDIELRLQDGKRKTFTETAALESMANTLADDVLEIQDRALEDTRTEIAQKEFAARKTAAAKGVPIAKVKASPAAKAEAARKTPKAAPKRPAALKTIDRKRASELARRRTKEKEAVKAAAEKAKKRTAEKAKPSKLQKVVAAKRISPKKAENIFKFKDDTTLTGLTSGEVYEKATPAQKAEMDAGTAIEMFKDDAGQVRVRPEDIKLTDLQTEDRTFGIMSAENPQGKPTSKTANNIATKKLKNKLNSMNLAWTEAPGRYGSYETALLIEGATREQMAQLGKEFDQESTIYIGGNYAVYQKGRAQIETVSRKRINATPKADDFYTVLPDGTKFQIPFFEEIAQSIEDAGIVLDLSEVKDKPGFLEIMDVLAQHIKHGKRSWLHDLIKPKTKYVFINEEKALFKNEHYLRLSQMQKGKLADSLFGTELKEGSLATYHQEIDAIFFSMKNIQDFGIDRMGEIADHEALHALIKQKIGNWDSKTRGELYDELKELWLSIDSADMKIEIDADGWYVGDYFIHKTDKNGAHIIASIEAGIRQTNKNADELVTYAFTNPYFSHWLSTLQPSVKGMGKGRVKSGKNIWNKLTDIIARISQKVMTRNVVLPTNKLTDVKNIMNSYLKQDVTGEVRHAIRKGRKPGEGVGRPAAEIAESMTPLQKNAPNASKLNVVQTESDLPGHIKLTKQQKEAGKVIDAVYDEVNDTVHIVADNIGTEENMVKRWMHEQITHNGLRKLFGHNEDKLTVFLNDVGTVLKGTEATHDQLKDVAEMYGLSLTQPRQRAQAVEEWIAHYYTETNMKPTPRVNKSILDRFMDFIRDWLPARFLDKEAPKGTILTMEDLASVMEAAKANVYGRHPRLVKALKKALDIREPHNPSSLNDVKFQKTVKDYAKMALEVMEKYPDAKNWYNEHSVQQEKIFGKDGLVFNLLLSITSPSAKVIENVGHAVQTYLYMLGHQFLPGGLYRSTVKNKVDDWNRRGEDAIVDNLGGQFKINEFSRALLGDTDATVLDLWMHRLFFGKTGTDIFSTLENAAGRQILFDIANELTQQTGQKFTPRDTQAILWTWVNAKQTGKDFSEVGNFQVGFTTPRALFSGLNALEYLDQAMGLDAVKEGPLSDQMDLRGFEPTNVSRLEKKRRQQLSKTGAPARMSVTSKKGDTTLTLENDTKTAKMSLKPDGFIEMDVSATGEPGIATESMIAAIVAGGNKMAVDVHDVQIQEWAMQMGFNPINEDGIMEIDESTMDDFRSPKTGKVSPAEVRNMMGGHRFDIRPKMVVRHAIAQQAFQDDRLNDANYLRTGENSQSHINKLFEWKDLADLNIDRETARLEQEFLEEFGGVSVVGTKLGFGSGALKNTRHTKLLQKAMNLYIDSGDKTNNMTKVQAYKKVLEKKDKLTNVERDRLETINRMLAMTTGEKNWAMDNIKAWYDDMFKFANDNDIIDSYVEGYVRRAWNLPADWDIIGAAATGQTAGSTTSFQLNSPRNRKRSFTSIVDGWFEGTDFELKNSAIIPNITAYMKEINKVYANRRFVNYMKGLTNENGIGIFADDITEQEAKQMGYVQLKAQGMAPPFKKVYGRKDVAVAINKVTGQGKADFWSAPAARHLLRLNASLKSTILSVSAFHHFAGVRSWMFGVNKRVLPLHQRLNFIGAYKRGLDKIQKQVQFDKPQYQHLGPIVDFLVKNGLTIGRVQDWDEDLMRSQKGLVEGFLQGRTSQLSHTFLKMWRAGKQARENWTRALFNRFFAGLKSEAAALEFAHGINMGERSLGRGLTDGEMAIIAEKVGRLINADFGGLNLQRMGRNPNMQSFAQIFLLAPDWTESNFRTVTGMIPGLNNLIGSAIGDFKGPAGMDKVYRKFWFGIGWKLAASYALAHAATYMVADDEDKDRLIDFYKGCMTWEGFKRARWAMIPLDPWLNRIGAENKTGKWRGFRLGGHFLDIMKVFDPDVLIKHKVSPTMRIMETLISGTDWMGRPLTGTEEFIKTGRLVSDSKYEPVRNFWNRIIPTGLYTMRSNTPIFMQEAMKLVQGESTMLEATRAAGVDVRPIYMPDMSKSAYDEIRHDVQALDKQMLTARTARSTVAIRNALEAQREYPNFNKTKARLGYSKAQLKTVNAQIKTLEAKLDLGIELTKLETKQLDNLKKKRKEIWDKFVRLVEGDRK